ncbi:GntR family transcriptional regulator [Nocardioides sp. DS6]|uniref:GntR family transcriptional regulator n=1 Tax=Nocardioides eburneus TaxID=3231482 RepID=A0ABV3SUI0_9ACTN
MQVREYVRALVAGDSPGTPAPSERELVTRFGVARMTVRQAMDALVVEGLLERIPGRGTFVARPRRSPSTVVGLTEEMARRGVTVESQTLLARREHAGPGVARALGLHEGDSVVHWRRLRRAETEPFCVEDVYLEEGLLPGLLDGLLPSSLYAQLAHQGLRPTWVEDAVTADVAAGEEAGMLGLSHGAPVLRRQRRALACDRVVEVSRSVFRADRYTLRLQLGRAG